MVYPVAPVTFDHLTVNTFPEEETETFGVERKVIVYKLLKADSDSGL